MSTTHAPRLRHRPSRSTPASIVAVVLLALGVLSVLVAVLRLVDGTWPAPAQVFGRFLTATTWGAPAGIALAAGVALVGLVLLVAAVKPGRPGVARLRPALEPDGSTRTELVISRRAVARLAGARADTVDGVDGVSVNASATRVHLAVTSSSQQTEEVRAAVTDVVTRALTEAGLTPRPRVSTSVRTKEI